MEESNESSSSDESNESSSSVESIESSSSEESIEENSEELSEKKYEEMVSEEMVDDTSAKKLFLYLRDSVENPIYTGKVLEEYMAKIIVYWKQQVRAQSKKAVK